MEKPIIPSYVIDQRILFVRGEKVILDKELARLYGVKPFRLREQVKRNKDRFPTDFMFQLTESEVRSLVSQNAIPPLKYFGGTLPYVFTEHGALMAAGVIKSELAIKVSIEIIRSFVRLRELLSTHTELARQLESLENRYDAQFKVVFDAIRQLMAPAPTTEQEEKKGKIGYKVTEDLSK